MSLPEVERLDWDSRFLGFAVGRLIVPEGHAPHLASLVAQSQAAGIRLIYLVTDPTDSAAATVAHQLGARLADRKVTFARPTDGTLASSIISPVEPVTAFTPQLERLAWQSGEYSRFRRDAGFAPQVFPALYSQWLRTSLSVEPAQLVLAYLPPDGIETGLLTLRANNGVAHIGLLAVEARARGQGIGTQLMEAARQQALAWGCSQLQVVTQRDNVPACRLYGRFGFGLVQEVHIYHLWL